MNIYRELIKAKNYRQVFITLRRKAKEEPFRRSSSPVRKGLPLSWVLENELLVIKTLIKSLKSKDYRPEPCRQIELKADKLRILYSQSWPDRIIESLLASLITREVDPFLSERLYSFRKGRSNYGAVQSFSDFVTTSSKKNLPVFLFRHDVTSYGESISQKLLQQKLQAILGEQDSYTWTLLNSFLAPQYLPIPSLSIPRPSHQSTELKRLEKGLPAGFALTPVCENLYLADLDLCIEKDPDIFYARFGDDFIIASNEADKTIAADNIALDILKRHELSVKEEKESQLCFIPDQIKLNPNPFTEGRHIDYLGFSINYQGLLFLSQNKLIKLKSELRSTAKHALKAARRTTDSKDKLVRAVIKNINIFFVRELEQAYFPMILSSTTDIDRLKKLDKWLAKVTLRYVYGSGHDRVFRHKSYKQLRKLGLKSLLHLRNLAWRKR